MRLMGRPLRLDEHSADRLLGGIIAADDAPPGYGPVARVLDTAAAGLDGPAASGAPLDASERGTVAAMQAAVLGRVVPVPEPKRRNMRSTLLAPRAAAVAAALAVAGGTAAAGVTGNLPGQASPHAGTNTGLGVASSHAAGTHANNSVNPDVPTGPPSSVPADQNQNAVFGLCTAFLAGQGSGSKASAPPFAGLIAAHGGEASTTTYCEDFVATHPNGDVSASANQAPGGAGNSSSHAPVGTPNNGGTGTASSAGGGAGANGAGTASTASGGASNQGTGTAGTAGGNGTSTANGASSGASLQGSGNASTHVPQ